MAFGIANKIKRFFEQKAIVLMYHRVATPEIDPWQLSVSPTNFGEQLQVLKQYNIIPVDKLTSDLSKKNIKSGSVCITFDDGYADNYSSAKPLLEKYDVPATIYIASGYIGKQQGFWWDELESILLHTTQLPRQLSICINGGERTFEVPGRINDEDIEKQKRWKYPDEPPTPYAQLYFSLWEDLRPLPLQEIEQVLEQVETWAGYNADGASERIAMNEDQLQSVADSSLIALHAHTVTHPVLANYATAVQHDEIKASRDYLQHRFGKAVSTVSYPYGIYNDDTLAVVERQHFAAAFTTKEQLVTNRSLPFELGRFQVNDWNGDRFEEQLYKWSKYN